MIAISLSADSLASHPKSCYGFFLEEKFVLPVFLTELGTRLEVDIGKLLHGVNFTGKALQIANIPILTKDGLVRLVVVGLGDVQKKADLAEGYRRALGTMYKSIAALKIESFVCQLPAAPLIGVSAVELGKQTVIGFEMTAYRFNELISDPERKGTDIIAIICCVADQDVKQIQSGVDIGHIIAHAVNNARHWIDLPPSMLTPVDIAAKATAIAGAHENIKITVFDEKQVFEMGMGGLAGVSRGSDIDCQLVIMEYYTEHKDAPTIAIVGKGITFDSGGLSIKPAQSMETMKDDMSGAAAVISVIEAIAKIKPAINVIALAPLSENLINGKATKPGDVLRFYNGKTAEIKNTDAEGRLVLADALSYAVKHYKPDAIVDIATLTGACAYALGPFYTGLMSEHDEMVDRIQQSANATGDRVWRLPMHDDYRVAIKSDIADLCNIGKSHYRAGATTAAHFLQNFVGDVPWAHLDIAGSAFDVPDIPYYRTGATGAGVRLLIDLVLNWK